MGFNKIRLSSHLSESEIVSRIMANVKVVSSLSSLSFQKIEKEYFAEAYGNNTFLIRKRPRASLGSALIGQPEITLSIQKNPAGNVITLSFSPPAIVTVMLSLLLSVLVLGVFLTTLYGDWDAHKARGIIFISLLFIFWIYLYYNGCKAGLKFIKHALHKAHELKHP